MAQAKPTLRFAAVFSDKDIRADMVRMLAKDIAADFTVEPFFNASLFKQGTELVALQRDNLEMGNIAPQDISKQIPAWSILTSAYLFRDAGHLKRLLDGELGAQFKKQAEEQVKVKILGPTFFGTRQVGLKPNKKINTPADLAGIKLRMPPGDAWQLLGRSLGANPTPMAYAEVYTGLQTGAIDGQDNPLPNVQNMKFYEVMSQIVLTSHLVGYDLLCMNLKTWNAMARRGRSPSRPRSTRRSPGARPSTRSARRSSPTASASRACRSTPDQTRFRAHAQKVYLASDEAKEWPKGLLEKDQRAEVAPQCHCGSGRLAAPPGGERRRGPARGDVPRLHRTDRVPLSLQFPDRLDLRADGRHAGCGWCSGARRSCWRQARRSASICSTARRPARAHRDGIVFRRRVVILYGSRSGELSYVSFMKVEKPPTSRSAWTGCSRSTRLPRARSGRYLWLLWQLLRGQDPEAPTRPGELGL
jgi:hypothetical protein